MGSALCYTGAQASSTASYRDPGTNRSTYGPLSLSVQAAPSTVGEPTPQPFTFVAGWDPSPETSRDLITNCIVAVPG